LIGFAASIALTVLIWLFIAGWAGRLVFAPDMELLHGPQWPIWFVGLAVMYGPVIFAGWAVFKLNRIKQVR
jgi:hypothetical protein